LQTFLLAKLPTTMHTPLDTLGEFGLIDRIKSRITLQNKSTTKGIGDDAAVITPIAGHQLLVSTDMLVEKIHFDLSYVPLKHLGYKAVAVNVSDIAAMNALPQQLTVSIALSNRFSVEAIDELYAGMLAACEAYGIDLVGGDTTSSAAGLVISITVLGSVAADKIAYRSTAQPNDIICVTGDLGGAYLGLTLLEREKREFLANPNMQPDLDRFPYVVRRQLKPEARMDIIHELAELGVVPTAMIDISDGLASELLHLCKQSGVGATIFEDKLPIAKETYSVAIEEFKISPTVCALNGGEDYELLFTIKQTDYEKIKHHEDISTIGYMQSDKTVQLVTRNNQTQPLAAQGWKHF
jgi:thiamine-monophosphate kinase